MPGRRTFASLLYEAGASPAYVMAQMGHTSSALALEVYTKVMERKRDTGERLDALLRGADWAQKGTNDVTVADALSAVTTEEAVSSGFPSGRSRDRTAALLLVRQALSQLS